PLSGEPQQARLVEYRCVEIGVRGVRRQRKQAYRLRRGIDPGDGVLPAFGHPGRAVGAEDDSVRRGIRSERDLLELAAPGIEAAEEAFVVAGEPHSAVRRGRYVVRIGVGRQLVVLDVRSLRGGCGEDNDDGKEDEAGHGWVPGAARSRLLL